MKLHAACDHKQGGGGGNGGGGGGGGDSGYNWVPGGGKRQKRNGKKN